MYLGETEDSDRMGCAGRGWKLVLGLAVGSLRGRDMCAVRDCDGHGLN